MNNASYGWPVRAASPGASASNGVNRRPAPEGLPMKRGFDMTVTNGAGTLPRFHPQCVVPTVAEPPALLRTPGPPAQFSLGDSTSGVHPEFADSRVGLMSAGLPGNPLLVKENCNGSLSLASSSWPHNTAAAHEPHSAATAHEPGAPSRPRPPPVEVRSPPARINGGESPPPPGRLSFGSALGSSYVLKEELNAASEIASTQGANSASGIGTILRSSDPGCAVNPFTPTAPRIQRSIAQGIGREDEFHIPMSHSTGDRSRPGRPSPVAAPVVEFPPVGVESQDNFGWSDGDDEDKGQGKYGGLRTNAPIDGSKENDSDSLPDASDGSFDDDCNDDDNGSMSTQSSEESEGCSRQLVWPHAPSPQYLPSVNGTVNHAATTGSSRASSLSGSPLLESALAAAAARSEANAQAAAAAAGGASAPSALNVGVASNLRSVGSSLSSGFGGGWSDDNAGSRGSSLAADSPSGDHIGMQLNSNDGSSNSIGVSGGFIGSGSLAPLEAATLLTPRSGGVVLRSNNGRESTDPFLHRWPTSSTPCSTPATFQSSSSTSHSMSPSTMYPNIDDRSRSSSNSSVEHTPSIFSGSVSTFGHAVCNNNTYKNNSTNTRGNSCTSDGQGLFRNSTSNSSSLHFAGIGGVPRGSSVAASTTATTSGTRSSTAGFMGGPAASEKESPREEGSFPRRPRLRAAHRFHSPPGSAGSSSSDQLPPLSRPLNPVAATLTELERQESSHPRPSRLINHFPDPTSMAPSSSFDGENSSTEASPFASLTLSSGLTPRDGSGSSSGDWSSSGDVTNRVQIGANGAGTQTGDISSWPKIAPKGKAPSPTGAGSAPPPLFGKADSPARFAPALISSINSNNNNGRGSSSPTPGKPAAVRPIASSFARSPQQVAQSHNWASAAAAMSNDHAASTTSLPVTSSSPRVGFPSPSGLLNSSSSSNTSVNSILNSSNGIDVNHRSNPGESPSSGASTYAAFSVPAVPISPTSSSSIPGFAFGQPGFGSVNTNISNNASGNGAAAASTFSSFNALNQGDNSQFRNGATTGFLSSNSHENGGFNGGGFLVPIPIHGFQRMSVTQPYLGQ